MSVDDLGQLETCFCLLLKMLQHSRQVKQSYACKSILSTYSGGLAGSMMTASFVLSSDTR